MLELPIPSELQSTCRAIAAWAAGERFISQVYGFGSRFKGNHRPESDIDLAVNILGEDEGEILATIMFERSKWEKRLSRIIHLHVDLDLAHPEIAPNVWSYLTDGCALIFER